MTAAECRELHAEVQRPISCVDCPNPECQGRLLPATVFAWNLYHDVQAFGWDVATGLLDVEMTAAEAAELLEKFRRIRRFYDRVEERRAWERQKELERVRRT